MKTRSGRLLHAMSRMVAWWMVLTWGALAFAQGDASDVPPPKGIDVDVRGGAGRTLVKLAVPDTKASGGGGLEGRVQELLRKDLELAGFFELVPMDGLFFDPSKEGMSADDINFKNWSNVNAQGLIKSSVKLSGKKVDLDLRLYLVDKGKQARLKVTKSATNKDDYEAAVHDFVNAVLEYYTGARGIFGSRIAYVRRNKAGLKQIYVTDMSGESVQAITKNSSINLLPSWGPGGVIYFTSYRDYNPDLWVWEGGKARKLSGQRGQNSGASYCKGKLAVTLSMGGENTDIYLIDPKSGKKLQRLTDHWSIDTSPAWSPDCSKIAFVSARSSSPQIYVMNADGSQQRRLTYKGTYNTSPDWSPKGDGIVFQARDESRAFDLFTVDLNGTIERLTQNQGNNEDPSFSPDGRYVVFVSDRKGGKRIWIMTADGQYQRPVTKGSGYGSPSWAP